MSSGKDCDCGKVRETVITVPRPGNAAVATGGSSLVSALVRASEVLGTDTRTMANGELVDALCDALVEAREEKQALATALDDCFEEKAGVEDALDECQAGDLGDEE